MAESYQSAVIAAAAAWAGWARVPGAPDTWRNVTRDWPRVRTDAAAVLWSPSIGVWVTVSLSQALESIHEHACRL